MPPPDEGLPASTNTAFLLGQMVRGLDDTNKTLEAVRSEIHALTSTMGKLRDELLCTENEVSDLKEWQQETIVQFKEVRKGRVEFRQGAVIAIISGVCTLVGSNLQNLWKHVTG